MTEIWKDVSDYEEFYKASDYGRVCSLDRSVPHSSGGTAKRKGQILLPGYRMKNGALTSLHVTLCKDGTKTTTAVHRIVLEAFVGPCPAGLEGCHNDGDPTNNCLVNLRWDTHQNNNLDKRRDGTHRGRPVRRSDGVEFINMHVAAEETGCPPSNVWEVCNNKRKTAGSFEWEYV